MKKKIYITPSIHCQEGRLTSVIQASPGISTPKSTPSNAPLFQDGAVKGYSEFDYSKNRGNFYEGYDE